MSHGAAELRERIDRLYRSESRRVLATLIRLLGDFDLAEEALQDAFTAATEQWPRDGMPANPRAWLISTGRFKAIDRIPSAQASVILDRVGCHLVTFPSVPCPGGPDDGLPSCSSARYPPGSQA